MKQSMNQCNLETMFEIKNIPKEKRIRTILDKIKPDIFSYSFREIINNFQEAGELEKFKFMGK